MARRIFPVVLPVTIAELDRARGLMDERARLMARDALHAAFVLEHALAGICSYDRDFDDVPGVQRRRPGRGA